MSTGTASSWFLEQEARALLTRLERVKPFALQMPSVMAAAVTPAAQTAIETYLATGRKALRKLVLEYIHWLRSDEGQDAPAARAQSRFTIVRLRFNSVLAQFDIFADVLVQRSEHEFGIWLGGLDVVAADALALPEYYEAPPVICYLDRGHGAAIRRVRTRLPGGGDNPVAVVRVPRERMVGSGIGSSLVHEVGHQAAALLNLVNSLRQVLIALQSSKSPERTAWVVWERCISEIIADFWAVARLGIAATTGLMAVVSLPRAFVFRVNLDDPHPFPWIRVKLSCAMGRAIFPHAHWDRFEELWEAFYPLRGLDAELRKLVDLLEGTIPSFVSLLVNHRPEALQGKSLLEALKVEERTPAKLAALFEEFRKNAMAMRSAAPSLVIAVLGQARAEGKLTPEEESRWVGDLLTYWAMRGTLDMSALCSSRARPFTWPPSRSARSQSIEVEKQRINI